MFLSFFCEVFGRGPGVPVCRYLSPLLAHLFVVFDICWVFLIVFCVLVVSNDVFGRFFEVFGRGPGVPVCRYLSPLPAHLWKVFDFLYVV